ncbi:4Fe-4S dicluster domain-containing protein [Pseudoramibacter alactolyticus]|uniref:4Fe-4S dicluster domain-containing protein n=1 Tax=Pseudoramibacter alactolyticus TaxID=113287 RepID=UPI0036F27B10
MSLVDKVKSAGIVGAGGATFPTHVKIDATADVVIVNGAECEPLLRVDQQLMDLRASDMLEALQTVMDHTQAKEGIIGLKKKYVLAINNLNNLLKDYPKIKLCILNNFYPAGDEQTLVYETTGRIVPEGGIPLAVGALVMNVETLLNIHDYLTEEKPVIDKYLTVTGKVKRRITTKVPLGITVKEALTLAGGPIISDYVVVNGGPMMGKIVSEDSYITKGTKGLIVLPKDHSLIISKTRSFKDSLKLAATACMQCSLCSEVCPRNMLGHDLWPHKMMRIAAYAGTCDPVAAPTNAFLCCECGLCEYACVHDLQPWKVNQYLKGELSKAGIKNPHHNAPKTAHPFIEQKHFNVHRLTKRLGLDEFDKTAPMEACKKTFTEVNIQLSQHIGAPAKAVVAVGDTVTRGQVIGEIPEGALSARVFASIDGKVTAVGDGKITIHA